MIIQITRTRNELFLLKEMLPIWQKYADAFVFMDDESTDGTYEFLIENKKRYNILNVLRSNRSENSLEVESNTRQRLYDEALKTSNKIVCLDTDEYFDGNLTKNQLEELMDKNKDTMFHVLWFQYTGLNQIRVDGPWRINWRDRAATYESRSLFDSCQMHSNHLPMPKNNPHPGNPLIQLHPNDLFVAHLAWLDKRQAALKQYFWKISDYVNKTRFGAKIYPPEAYDQSVRNFQWEYANIPFTLKVKADIFDGQPIEENYKYKFIKESIQKYNIPNLNDWGMGIH